VVYTLLAVCTGLVLAARNGSWDPEPRASSGLEGRTSAGFRIELWVRDGRLESFDTRVHVRCPAGYRRDWRWYPEDNVPVPFKQRGNRFRVVEEGSNRANGWTVRWGSEMHGRLEDDGGQSAAGSIRSWAVWTKGRREIACSGTATFRTRRNS
jgi:hypothetical protein